MSKLIIQIAFRKFNLTPPAFDRWC